MSEEMMLQKFLQVVFFFFLAAFSTFVWTALW